MATGSVTIKVRPLRIAFLVDPKESRALQEAIEINSTLWGGEYNPIIPVFGRTPKNWEPKPIGHTPTPSAIINGYLDGFDPDLVVPIGKCAERTFNIGNRETVTPSKLKGNLVKEGKPNFGIGLFEILNEFIRKELKYERRRPIEIKFPKYTRKYRLFLTSIFGSLPNKIMEIVNDNYRSHLGDIEYSCSINNYMELLGRRKMFPRRLNSWQLKDNSKNPTLFVCDATSHLDIIDYWNLRAAGCFVIPVPIQASDNDNVRSFARNFIEYNYRPYRNNPSMYHDTTIQRSRGLDEDVVNEFARSLKISQRERVRVRLKY